MKRMLLFLLTYFIATLIRAAILTATGFSFSVLTVGTSDFELISFLGDILIWVFSYFIAATIIKPSDTN